MAHILPYQKPSYHLVRIGIIALFLSVSLAVVLRLSQKESITSSPQAATAAVVTKEQTVTGSTTTTNATSVRSASMYGGTNKLYLASVSIRGTSSAYVSKITGLGLSWTKVRSQCSGRGLSKTEVWKAYGNAGSGYVTATLAGGTRESAVISVTRYSGFNAISPIGNSIGRNSRGTNSTSCSGGSDASSYSVNLSTGTAKSMIYGAVSLRNVSHTPGSGYTELSDRHTSKGSGLDAGLATEQKLTSTTGSYAVNGSMSSRVDYAVVAVEIKPATTSTTALSPTRTPTRVPTRTPTPGSGGNLVVTTCTSGDLLCDLQAYWNMNETYSGSKIPRNNSVSGSYRLTDNPTTDNVTNEQEVPSGVPTPSYNTGGKISKASHFGYDYTRAAASSRLIIPVGGQVPQRAGNGSFTIAGWYKLHDVTESYSILPDGTRIRDKTIMYGGNNDPIISNYSGTEYNVYIRRFATSSIPQLQFYIMGKNSSGVNTPVILTRDTITSINTNEWKFFAARFDGSTNPPKIQLRHNNGTDMTVTPNMQSYYINLPYGEVRIGSYSGGSGLAGWIDELGFWSRYLSDGEVLSLYNSGAGKTYPFDGSTPPTPTRTPTPPLTQLTYGWYDNASQVCTTSNGYYSANYNIYFASNPNCANDLYCSSNPTTASCQPFAYSYTGSTSACLAGSTRCIKLTGSASGNYVSYFSTSPYQCFPNTSGTVTNAATQINSCGWTALSQSGCPRVVGSSLSFTATDVQFGITNPKSIPVNLESLTVSWTNPSGMTVNSVKVGASVLSLSGLPASSGYSSTIPQSSATSIPANTSKSMTLSMNNPAAGREYTLRLTSRDSNGGVCIGEGKALR